jgi:hypothetical protein
VWLAGTQRQSRRVDVPMGKAASDMRELGRSPEVWDTHAAGCGSRTQSVPDTRPAVSGIRVAGCGMPAIRWGLDKNVAVSADIQFGCGTAATPLASDRCGAPSADIQPAWAIWLGLDTNVGVLADRAVDGRYRTLDHVLLDIVTAAAKADMGESVRHHTADNGLPDTVMEVARVDTGHLRCHIADTVSRGMHMTGASVRRVLQSKMPAARSAPHNAVRVSHTRHWASDNAVCGLTASTAGNN